MTSMSETEPGVVRPSLKLRLENFRLFRDSTLFNLAPLTCLVGRNSSGKSSILSAILLLKQSLEQESIGREIAPLVLTGPYCDLGDYDDVVHNHMRSEAISFSFSMDVLDLKRADWQGDAPFVDLSRQKPMHDDYYFFRRSEKLPDEGSVNVRLTFSVNRPFGPSLSRVEVGVSEVGTASCIRTIRGERKQHWRTYTRGVPPRSIEFHLAGQRVFPWVGVRASQYKRFDQKRKKIIRLFSTVSNLLLRFLEGTLSRSEVIGPFRPAPERRYVFGGFGASRGGPTGEQAVNFLISETVLKSHGGRSLHGALAFWISHLKLAKSLRVKDLTHRQNLFEVDVKGAGSRAESNLSDVGFGVSQVLPVRIKRPCTSTGRTCETPKPTSERLDSALDPAPLTSTSNKFCRCVRSLTRSDFANLRWLIQNASAPCRDRPPWDLSTVSLIKKFTACSPVGPPRLAPNPPKT